MLNNWQEQGWDFCDTGTWVLCISTTSWNMTVFCKSVTSIARVYFVSEGETNALTVGMRVNSWCEQSTWFPNPAVSAQGVAWICPRLSPSMQWYWYYLVPRRNTLVQDLARFVSKNVWESSFYWTRLSLSNNLETKCFSVMLILLFYFCMFIRFLCVSLYISIIVFHVMYYVYSIHDFVFISIIISYHFPWHLVLFVEYHSMGALEVFRLQGLGNYRL